jgi:hypothetical protein
LSLLEDEVVVVKGGGTGVVVVIVVGTGVVVLGAAVSTASFSRLVVEGKGSAIVSEAMRTDWVVVVVVAGGGDLR